MKKLESSLDWQEIKAELISSATGVIPYTELYKTLSNLDNEIKKLGNEEIHARTTGKTRRMKEMVDSINLVLEVLEQHILLKVLS